MTTIILCVILIGFLIIATESFHHINKSAVAMFIGVLCWVLYIGYGTDYVLKLHGSEFSSFLESNVDLKVHAAKSYIAQNIFSHYIIEAVQIIFYLLSTMSIIEVLSNNGCFDFIKNILWTRSTRKFFWFLCGITFLLSMNWDNLTTVCLMLGVTRVLVKEEKLRWFFGSAIVITANAAGALTVTGESTTMLLWIKSLVAPVDLFSKLIIPVLVALLVILLLISKKLPRKIMLQNSIPTYRGDDDILKSWQRYIMMFVGFSGLWFIPLFHKVTLLPPFVGALCILALLWILHELFNSSLLSSDRMIRSYKPLALQYDTLQNILFFLGLFMALAAVVETGVLKPLFVNMLDLFSNIYCINVVFGLLSAFFGNVCTMLAGISIFHQNAVGVDSVILSDIARCGDFWTLLSYTTALGASMLTIGSFSGFSLMKMEGLTFAWYLKHITFKVLAGWIAGLLVFAIIEYGFWMS